MTTFATRSVRHEELASFLVTRRARLSPESCGLPSFRARRRTPGLRREDVSSIAGISTAYYTWIEQGRTFDISADVLHAIAGALQLNKVETAHLFTLAGKAEPGPPLHEEPIAANAAMNAAILEIIGGLGTAPALTLTPWLDVIGTNEVAAEVLGVGSGQNLACWLLCGKNRNVACLNSAAIAAPFLAQLRRNRARDVDNQRFADVIECLRTESAVCRALWDEHVVDTPPFFDVDLEHARLGRLSYHSMLLCDSLVLSRFVLFMLPLTSSPP